MKEEMNFQKNHTQIPLHYIEDIEKRLDALAKKRKKRKIILFLFPTLLFGFIALFVFSFDKGTNNHNPKKEIATHTILKKSSYSHDLISNKKGVSIEPNPINNSIKNNRTKGNVNTYRHRNNQFPIPQQIENKSIDNYLSNEHFKYETVVIENLLSNQKIETVLISESINPKDSLINEAIVKNIIDSETVVKPQVTISVPNGKKTKNEQKLPNHYVGFKCGVSGIVSSFTIRKDISMIDLVTLKSYTEERSLAEKSTSSWDFSFFYRNQRNKLILQTGLDYFEWGEQIQYDFSSLSGINRYHYISVPLSVGTIFQKKSIQFIPQVGLSIGGKIKGRGYYLEPFGTIDLIESKSIIGTGILQLEFAYNLEPIQFTLTPIYRVSLNHPIESPFTKNSYQSFGCQIGMTYSIGN